MGHPDSKDPPNLYVQYEYTHTQQVYVQCSTDQYVYTHTQQDFFSLSYTYAPQTKKSIGHVDEKLTKGWQQIHVPPTLNI